MNLELPEDKLKDFMSKNLTYASIYAFIDKDSTLIIP